MGNQKVPFFCSLFLGCFSFFKEFYHSLIMKKIIITIDGWSACGKSTLAKQLANKLNYVFIDSGAMYRAITLFFLREHINWTDPNQVTKALENISIEFVVFRTRRLF